MRTRPIVVVTERLEESALEWMRRRAEVLHVDPDAGTDELHAALASAAGLVVRTSTDVNIPLLASAPDLRVIGRAGVGLDNIDVAACRERGIEVVYTPGANTQAVVEFVLGIIMRSCGLPEPLPHAVDAVAWRALRTRTAPRLQVAELTVGILGLGRIGSRLAGVLSTLGARVLYHDLLDIRSSARQGAQFVTPEMLFRQSDIVTIHIDGRPANRRLIDRDWFGHLRRDAVFVNTSRGLVVDNSALSTFLADHPGAFAHLDVHDPEPIPMDSPFWGLHNARLYPHISARTRTALRNMSLVVEDVAAVLDGRPPQWPAPV